MEYTEVVVSILDNEIGAEIPALIARFAPSAMLTVIVFLQVFRA